MSPYRDPADRRLLVPKAGGGLSLNFAHPAAWWLFVTMTLVPLLVVAGLLIAYLA